MPPFWNAINKNSPDNVFESRAYVFISKPTATIPFLFPASRVSWLGLYNRAGEKMYAQIYFDGCAFAFIRVWWLPAMPRHGGYEFSYSTVVHVHSHRSPRLGGGAQWCSPFRRWNEERGEGGGNARLVPCLNVTKRKVAIVVSPAEIFRGYALACCWLS